MARKKVEDKAPSVYVLGETGQYNTRLPIDNEEEYCDRGDTHTDWHVTDVVCIKDGGHRSVEVTHNILDDGVLTGEYDETKPVYALVVIYSTGDSFGHDSGAHLELVFASQNEDHVKEVKSIIENAGEDETSIKVPYLEYPIYAAWTGYFESLDSIEIYSSRV